MYTSICTWQTGKNTLTDTDHNGETHASLCTGHVNKDRLTDKDHRVNNLKIKRLINMYTGEKTDTSTPLYSHVQARCRCRIQRITVFPC